MAGLCSAKSALHCAKFFFVPFGGCFGQQLFELLLRIADLLLEMLHVPA